MTSKTRLQILLSLIGVLGLLASLALAAGTMRPTEATWQDTVAGEATFGTVENAGQNYARGVSSYGTIQRQWTSHTIGPGLSEAQPGSRFSSGPVTYNDDGLLGVLPLRLNGYTCATTMGDRATECGAPAGLRSGSGYAASEASRIGLWAAGLEGIENLSYGASGQTPIRATATCRPGERGEARVTMDGPLYIRSDTHLHLPPANHQTYVDRPVATRNVTVLLQNYQSSGPDWAKAELRIYAKSTIALSGWTLHAVLASAECGLARPAPTDLQRPTTDAPTQLPQAPNVPTGVTAPSRAAFQPFNAQVDEQLTDAEATENQNDEAADPDQDEAKLPSLPTVGESVDEDADDAPTRDQSEGAEKTTTQATSTTSSPMTSAPVPSETSTEQPAPGISGPAISEAALPESADPTTPTETTPAPQTPQDVTVGRSFPITGPDGTQLATAKIEDIVRTPGCGVELTLHITTSAEAGPGRWSSIGPDDFAEVRPGGATRDAQRISSDCEHAANSRATALSPDRSYELVIAFHLSDSATRAMLRPEGTAGWIVDLPPLTAVTPTTSPATATSTAAEETTEA